MAKRTTKTELTDIEFAAASDLYRYCEKLRAIGMANQKELEEAAAELQVILSRSTGAAMDRSTASRKAKRVTDRLRNASMYMSAAGREGVQASKAFKREFAPLLDPPKKGKKSFAWTE